MEEAFSYQNMNHPCFLEDSANYFQQYYDIEMPLLLPQQAGEMSNAASSCFTCYNSSDVELVLPTPQASSEKTRKKSGHASCLNSTGQSKGAKGSTNRRQKKAVTHDKQAKAKELNKAATSEEPPSGYLHVKARRGQATDSQCLAERVRRERISERMKRLQELVPGCDQVIGQALVLDEIINYVQSLQNQVEFLSMKLTSANPVIYDFGADYNDELMNQPEELGSMSQPMPSVVQHTPPTAFEGAANNFQIAAASLDGGSFLMRQVGGHATSGLLSQVELHNMFSFH